MVKSTSVGERTAGREDPTSPGRGFSSQPRAGAVEFPLSGTTVPLQTDSDFAATTANRSLVPTV